jgi:hypothetical protein
MSYDKKSPRAGVDGAGAKRRDVDLSVARNHQSSPGICKSDLIPAACGLLLNGEARHAR